MFYLVNLLLQKKSPPKSLKRSKKRSKYDTVIISNLLCFMLFSQVLCTCGRVFFALISFSKRNIQYGNGYLKVH